MSGKGPEEIQPEEPVEEKVGFLNNLSEEERERLERRNAEIAEREARKRDMKAMERAKAEFEAKRSELARKRAVARGHKLAEANRIYYDESGWVICEVCDKKFFDFDCIDEHIATAKHISNLAYFANGRDHTSYANDEGPFPEFVEWREDEMMYFCVLCEKKAATMMVMEGHLESKDHKKRVANKDWYLPKTGSAGSTSLPGPGRVSEIPACVEWSESEMNFICRWCDKRGADEVFLQAHLEGKEHAKKCANVGVPNYGEPGHLEAVRKFVADYGFDIWARGKHWPAWIVDTPTCWKCTMCAKGLVTRFAVEEHLEELHSGLDNGVVPKRSAPVVATARPIGPPLVGARAISNPPPPPPSHRTSAEYHCTFCSEWFMSKADLAIHEESDMHRHIIEEIKRRTHDPLIDLSVDY
jgi:hypothetical protein